MEEYIELIRDPRDQYQPQYLKQLEMEWKDKESDPEQLEEFKAVMIKELGTLNQVCFGSMSVSGC